ncbi:MAG: site-specific integrase [Firmicutes bacterium]|nr:site-specific integrase [Bacillota bacterium]
MRLNPQKMLENYKRSLRGSHKVYVPMIERYLKDMGYTFDRRAIEIHLEHLREQGYSDGTIELVFRTLHRFYKVNGIEWPFQAKEGPTVREMKVFAPALSPELVHKLIREAKQGNLDKRATAMLALSTTYGLRRAEMANLSPENVNLQDRLLFVETVKFGRQRYHLIPEEIIPYIEGYEFRRCSLVSLSLLWHEIEEAAGLPRRAGVGWHSIRRILNRELIVAGVPVLAVETFLRWKRSGSDMVRKYYAVTVIGEESKMELGVSDRETDEMVFKAHPFLPIWRDKNAEKKAQ